LPSGYWMAMTSTPGASAFDIGRKKGADPPACGRHTSREAASGAGRYRRHHRLSSEVG
jgi:hypothetical protein